MGPVTSGLSFLENKKIDLSTFLLGIFALGPFLRAPYRRSTGLRWSISLGLTKSRTLSPSKHFTKGWGLGLGVSDHVKNSKSAIFIGLGNLLT